MPKLKAFPLEGKVAAQQPDEVKKITGKRRRRFQDNIDKKTENTQKGNSNERI